jgi:putative PIN family toxin of toxin-antitoxin system
MHLPKVVIDTCVIVSALRSRQGASFRILENIGRSRFRYGLSVPLYLEYEAKCVDLCKSREIDLTGRQTHAILDALGHYGERVPLYFSIRPNLRDEGDNMVLECAVNFGAHAIVTHNVRDFLNADLGPYRLEVITPQKFIADREVFHDG